ncbi:PREDICTED: exocyst complex component EXO70A1 [Tarenaya hassleriana]|uniref:exocyst complex component EXO70A1 n=1 Tax=Tarenaya hassleriana TaxID=28532 RepID=UPI00053C9D01|nr:PREDICTED: exocyst complex component EXO70A1 [Tarenaya hassleriana]
MVLLKSSPSRLHSRQSLSESLMEGSIQDSEAIISRWTSPELHDSSFCSLSSLFSPGNQEEANRFIEAVTSLQCGMQRLVKMNPGSEMLVRAQSLMSIAMKHLEKEFYRILKSTRRSLDPESVSIRSSGASSSSTPRSSRKSVSDSESDVEFVFSVSNESRLEGERGGEDANAMADLKMIADCMIFCGYSKECLKIYKKIRKSVVVEALDHLGFEDLRFTQIQKLEWEILESKIKKWVRTAREAVATLFFGERILCDYVFSSSSFIRESAFAEVTQESALSLFGFPENVAKCRKSPEKIFRTLDVYQAISEIFPKIEQVFSCDSTVAVRSQAVESLYILGEAIRSMISELELSISKEPSKTPIPCGGVHHITRYVMNFIVFLADYTGSLADILTKTPPKLPEDYLTGGGENPTGATIVSSPVATNLAWVILVLLCKIDAKSRLYNDVALSYLFLANNLHYIVVKVRTSNLKVPLSNWVTKHEDKVREYVARFERLAWGDVMTSLSGVPTEEEIFRRFNEAFEEAYKRQSDWVIPDPKLRDEIKVSVARKLIPGYSEHYKSQRVMLNANVRYAPEDIGNYISDLYFGSGGAGGGGSTSSFCSSNSSSGFER